jgi:acyl-CoA thioesterase
MGSLDDALALTSMGTDRWQLFADPDHESANGMFGGWTAAASLAAVLASARERTASASDGDGDGGGAAAPRRPAALTVNYVGVVVPGTEPIVHVEHLGGSRSIDHWRADLRTAVDGDVLASATVILASPRPTDGHTQPTMPPAPEPQTLPEFHPPGAQGHQTELRLISGSADDYGRGDTQTSAWIRMASERPVDHLQLAYLSDQFAPRSFYWGAGLRPSATLALSVTFFATDEELADAGTDHLLNEATGTRGAHAASGQQGRFWSRSGALLSTTERLDWYR